ncbi:HEPN domain-containing protein [Baaleninema simplex]|uniref:HEPN domain-containing protein n=1 Tax=Baaleninema simplex TaxID=2862350 RepID=UPI00036BD73B|nr:HEPN domain-containing protein [Baaleninema simplex]
MNNFDGKNFLVLAEKILKNSQFPSEASYRTSISRAYYAVFLTAREYIKVKNPTNWQNIITRGGNVHKKVKNYYASRFGNNGKRITNKLNSLRKKRNNADYEISTVITKSQAEQACLDAKTAINLIGQLR